MKNISLSLLMAMIAFSSIDACVNYNPSSKIYTVDSSGCVKKPKENKKK